MILKPFYILDLSPLQTITIIFRECLGDLVIGIIFLIVGVKKLPETISGLIDFLVQIWKHVDIRLPEILFRVIAARVRNIAAWLR